MQFILLDEDSVPIKILQKFQSCVWIDRYIGYGEFELIMPWSLEADSLFQMDRFIRNSETNRVMIIEDARSKYDSEEGRFLHITGRSLESILERRIPRERTTGNGTLVSVDKTISDYVFNAFSGALRDFPTFLNQRSLPIRYEAATDPSITNLTMINDFDRDSLYNIVDSICRTRNLGYKIVFNTNNRTSLYMTMSLYLGTDKSTDVIYSEQRDNLSQSERRNSTLGYRNGVWNTGHVEWDDSTEATWEQFKQTASEPIWNSNILTPSSNEWRSVCFGESSYGRGSFVAVASSGTGNRCMTSSDGITWTLRATPADNNWTSVCYGNGQFVAVASSGTGNRCMTSKDGRLWTLRTTPADNNWSSVCYGKDVGLFVAVASSGTGNRVMTSPDGITWTLRTTPANNNWTCVAYGYDYSLNRPLFVAMASSGTGNRCMTSANGTSWTIKSTSNMPDINWTGIVSTDLILTNDFSNNIRNSHTFYACATGTGSNSQIGKFVANKNSNWTMEQAGGVHNCTDIAYSPSSGLIIASTDGAGLDISGRALVMGIPWLKSPPNWGMSEPLRDTGFRRRYSSICYGNGKFIMVSYSGTENRAVVIGSDRPTGLKLREIVVDLSDRLWPTDAELTDEDRMRITDSVSQGTLNLNGLIKTFTGTIDNTRDYRPGIDYEVGDLVGFMDLSGMLTKARVTEIVYSSENGVETVLPSYDFN